MEITNTKGMTAQEIADELNKNGYDYFGERARALTIGDPAVEAIEEVVTPVAK